MAEIQVKQRFRKLSWTYVVIRFRNQVLINSFSEEKRTLSVRLLFKRSRRLVHRSALPWQPLKRL